MVQQRRGRGRRRCGRRGGVVTGWVEAYDSVRACELPSPPILKRLCPERRACTRTSWRRNGAAGRGASNVRHRHRHRGPRPPPQQPPSSSTLPPLFSPSPSPRPDLRMRAATTAAAADRAPPSPTTTPPPNPLLTAHRRGDVRGARLFSLKFKATTKTLPDKGRPETVRRHHHFRILISHRRFSVKRLQQVPNSCTCTRTDIHLRTSRQGFLRCTTSSGPTW